MASKTTAGNVTETLPGAIPEGPKSQAPAGYCIAHPKSKGGRAIKGRLAAPPGRGGGAKIHPPRKRRVGQHRGSLRRDGCRRDDRLIVITIDDPIDSARKTVDIGASHDPDLGEALFRIIKTTYSYSRCPCAWAGFFPPEDSFLPGTHRVFLGRPDDWERIGHLLTDIESSIAMRPDFPSVSE